MYTSQSLLKVISFRDDIIIVVKQMSRNSHGLPRSTGQHLDHFVDHSKLLWIPKGLKFSSLPIEKREETADE